MKFEYGKTYLHYSKVAPNGTAQLEWAEVMLFDKDKDAYLVYDPEDEDHLRFLVVPARFVSQVTTPHPAPGTAVLTVGDIDMYVRTTDGSPLDGGIPNA